MKRNGRLVLSVLSALIAMLLIAQPAFAGDRWRFGFGANRKLVDYPDWPTLGASWFHIWGSYPSYNVSGLTFYPMVAAYGDLMGDETLESLQQRYNWKPQYYPPGTVWIISNELQYDIFCTKNGVPLNPCRAITPTEYAEKFKKYYDIIRQLQPYGPTYKFAIGFINAIAEPDRPYTLADVLDAYKARWGVDMPVDVFNLHAYGFGRSIDFDYCFVPTITTYRQVMADKGYRDKPLIITEVGVLEGVYVPTVPQDYVLNFMVQAFDWLRTARSETTGMPSDDNRLVQRWAWFALTSWHPSDDHKWRKTALFDIDTKQITVVGEQYRAYLQSLTHTITTTVQPGWNLLSVPVELSSYAITDVLSSLAGSYDLAYTYDAQTDTWRVYDVAAPPGANTLTTLNPGDGLWVHATAPDDWVVSGEEQPLLRIPLHEGWNLIAYPLVSAKPIAEALSSIAGKYTAVYAYDPARPEPWLKHVPEAPPWASDLSQMAPGKGYWVKVTQDCTVEFAK